jgi:hypothetical protein
MIAPFSSVILRFLRLSSKLIGSFIYFIYLIVKNKTSPQQFNRPIMEDNTNKTGSDRVVSVNGGTYVLTKVYLRV